MIAAINLKTMTLFGLGRNHLEALMDANEHTFHELHDFHKGDCVVEYAEVLNPDVGQMVINEEVDCFSFKVSSYGVLLEPEE